MTLAVLSVAFPFAPIDSDPVGGAEQVLAQLDRALVAAGHRSIVVAAEGSRACDRLIAIPRVRGPLDDATCARVRRSVRAAIAAALAEERVDLVHLHGSDFEAYLPPPGPPALATLHLPIAWYAHGALRSGRPRTWLLPVSAHQARGAPPSLALLEPIGNGVDVDAFPRAVGKRAFALALGRICPEKGLHEAIDAAKRAGVPLLVAGEAFAWAEHQRYLREEFVPRLDARRRWIGPVGGARKRRLIAAARCVLIPSRVAETSSLVAMEAIAAGTPAIAYPSGALAEIVEHGRTGFLVRDADEMAAAIGIADRIEPEVCRSVARERFAAARMTAAYLALYARLAATGDAGAKRPRMRARC